MNFFDFHVHSNFSDGKDSVEDIILKAIDLGLNKIGISDHSYTSFDESYCISKENIGNYINTVNKLKAKYADIIDVSLGVEQDYFSSESTSEYDYVIGSVHYIKVSDNYIPVDESADILVKAADDYFAGDIYALIDAYYITVADVVNKTKAEIIGHFDLISKFNENGKLFNENDERYIKSFKLAADSLLNTGAIFEINTGAISRGYRTSPYPSNQILEYLKSKGAKFVLSSDSHDKDTLCYSFEKYLYLL